MTEDAEFETVGPGTDLAHRTGSSVMAAPANQSGSMLEAIIAAARDPAVDAGKMEAMANLALKLQTHEQQQQFNRDKNAAIMEMPVITKDGRILIADKNTGAVRQQGRFARIEDIDRVVRPIAMRHNLAYSWDIGDEGGVPKVYIELSHANGFVQRSSGMRLPIDSSGGKNNVQGSGSSVTYGKRYTLCAAFNIQTEGVDDDGTEGGQPLSLPYERETAVLESAEQAAAAGGYQDWFNKQSPKDRAWLIQRGHHARLGGAALPAPEKPATGASAGQTQGPGPAAKQGTPDKTLANVEAYEAGIAKCASLDAMAVYQEEPARAEWLKKLKARRPDLYDRIVAANSKRHDELVEAEPKNDSADDDLDYSDGASSDELFPE